VLPSGTIPVFCKEEQEVLGRGVIDLFKHERRAGEAMVEEMSHGGVVWML
jgi:hypothetical protein